MLIQKKEIMEMSSNACMDKECEVYIQSAILFSNKCRMKSCYF